MTGKVIGSGASAMTLEEIIAKLEHMQADPRTVTNSIYSPSAHEFPDNQLPFVHIHLAYLQKHRNVDPAHYLSNLQIMITKR